MVAECTGPEGGKRGENEGKRGGGKGPEKAHSKNSDFGTDFCSRPWRNLPPTWAIHMASPLVALKRCDS